MSSATRAKLLVLAVFGVGVVTGALVENVYETRWRVVANESPRREVTQIYDMLELTTEQRRQWDAILAESKPEYDRIWEENRQLTAPNQQRYAELQRETRSKIREILTDEQREIYDSYNERRRRQRQSPPRQQE
jgi:hypothetical protein